MASPINDNGIDLIHSVPETQASETSDTPKSIPTPATEWAPKGRIIDDSARGTIFWEADPSEDEEEDTGGASTDVVPSASEQQQIAFEESHTLSEMEQAFVDLTGGTDDSQNVPQSTGALRQEEEESTQDMMMEIHEIHQHQRVIDESTIENGWDLGPAVSDSIPMDVVIEPTTDAIPMVETNGALDTIPEVSVHSNYRWQIFMADVLCFRLRKRLQLPLMPTIFCLCRA